MTAPPDGGRSAPPVRIVIVNYNAGPHLSRAVRAVLAQTRGDFELVVVDNGSTDSSLDGLPDDPRLSIRRMKTNLGFAAANNRGAEDASGDWLATLNPDAFPEPGWLEALLAAASRHPGSAMFASTQLRDGDPARLDGAGDAYFVLGLPWRGGHGRPATERPVADGACFAPCAAAALYDLAAFRAAGEFDERFFCYCEDVDLAFRLRLAGKSCVLVPDAVVRHVGAASAGAGSDFMHYHSARNRIWLFVKDMPGALFWPLLLPFAATNLSLLAWGTARGHGDPVWRGMSDALATIGPVWADRRRLQATRRASAWTVARALSWSPIRLFARRTDLRPPHP